MKFLLFFSEFQSWEALEAYAKDKYPQNEWMGLLGEYCSSEASLLENNERAKNAMRFLWDNFIIPAKNEKISNADELANFLNRNGLHLLSKYGYDIFIHETLLYLSQLDIISLIDINKSDDKTSKTALFLATENNNDKTVAVLLKFNATMDKKSDNGRYWETPVHQAAGANSLSCLKVFFDHNNRCFHIYDDRAYSPLHIAMLNGNIDMVTWMLKADETLSLAQSTEKNSRISLHLLAEHPFNHQEMIQFFSERHPDLINHKTAAGETALHLAIKNAAYSNVEVLLKIKADVTIANVQSDLPLFLAFDALVTNYRSPQKLHANIEIIKLLLSNEEVTLINSDGQNLQDYIENSRFSEIIIKQLQKYPEIDLLIKEKRNQANANINNKVDYKNIVNIPM